MAKSGTLYRWCFLLLWWVATGVSAQTAFVLPARSADRPTTVTSQFDVLEDPSLAVTLGDVMGSTWGDRFVSRENEKGSPSFGITRSAYWLRLSIRNSKDQPVEQFMEVAYPRLIHLDFYRVRDGVVEQTVRTGYAQPFSSRAYPSRNFVFPMVVPPGETVVYLRVESRSSLEVPTTLWSSTAYKNHERADHAMQWCYFGMAIAMTLFNLLLLFSLRERGYFYYLIFVIGFTFSQLSVSGIGTQLVWDGYTQWTTISFGVSAHVAAVGLLLFMRHMVGTKALLKPWFEKAVLGVVVLNVVAMAVAFVDYQIHLTLFSIMCTEAVTLLGAVLGVVKGQRSAKIFLAAFMVVCVSMITTILRIVGVLPGNVFTFNGLQIGSAIEMIVLAFALADRFHVLRAQKERAQAEALAAERQLVETLRASERALEERVRERTAELADTLAQLQKSQNDLVEAEKLASLGSLVAGVAHELNTPIGNALVTATAMDAESKTMEQQLAGGNMKRSALETFLRRSSDMSDMIVRSCQRAVNLITSFKKVSVDQTSEQKREFDLRELVNDNLAIVAAGLRDMNVEMSVRNDVPGNIGCNSYPGPLGQVLANLLQNAAVHAFDPQDKGTVTIEASSSASHVTLVVRDDGKGMTPDVLKHIFDPFFTTRLGQGGSGLGLSICRNMVSGVLGGSIHAQSTPGVGTAFTIEFPLQAPQNMAQRVSTYSHLQQTLA